MNVIIVEDERPAAERLVRALKDYSERIQILAHLQTVEETIGWFRTHRDPDLMFLDVHLTDGLSLDLFRSASVNCPVIFTTAYDAYILDAFECNSIDYLLKPIRPERLAQAMQKYEKLRRHFGGDVADLLRQAAEGNSHRHRLLGQKGTSFVALDVSALRYAYSKDKITFLVDTKGERYLCDEALTTLEDALDPTSFFRLNRKYLVHVDAVRAFRPASRGRLWIEIDPPSVEELLVSQEKAARFRSWIGS